ncbi:hypothetical protein CEXT_709471 [Caerostris extrusa]|uniref:Uncharacterized protein n=1 Tax=Caerostris extrusa TaxID=172846 RepID=A0AAV4Q403_CAEEX|nr:hypothetical protein CEXT_709471 [Caerostris extrusa]
MAQNSKYGENEILTGHIANTRQFLGQTLNLASDFTKDEWADYRIWFTKHTHGYCELSSNNSDWRWPADFF